MLKLQRGAMDEEPTEESKGGGIKSLFSSMFGGFTKTEVNITKPLSDNE